MKSILCLVALFATTIVYGQYGWFQKTSMNTGRYAGTGFSIGNKGYVCTGYNTANVTQSDLWEWDQATNVWTQKANITNARFGAASFVIDGFAYVGLGLSSGGFYSDLQRYDPATNTWTVRASLPAPGRYGSSSFTSNGKGYIACGNLGSASGPYSTQLWEYDPISNSWAAKAAFPGLSRYGGRAAAINNIAFVYGGLNGIGSSQSSFFSDLWAYDASLNSWSQKTNMPGLGRSYAAVFILDNKFVAGAGVHFTGNQTDFNIYDPLTNTWSALPDLPATARWAPIGFNTGGNGYVATGILPNNSTTGELWELKLTTGINSASQQEMISINAFPNPFSHSATINFMLKEAGDVVTVDIYNLKGQKIKSLYNEFAFAHQEYNLKFDGSTMPAGVYFCHVKTGNVVHYKKITLIK